jgi:hypothetical protein
MNFDSSADKKKARPKGNHYFGSHKHQKDYCIANKKTLQ